MRIGRKGLGIRDNHMEHRWDYDMASGIPLGSEAYVLPREASGLSV